MIRAVSTAFVLLLSFLIGSSTSAQQWQPYFDNMVRFVDGGFRFVQNFGRAYCISDAYSHGGSINYHYYINAYQYGCGVGFSVGNATGFNARAGGLSYNPNPYPMLFGGPYINYVSSGYMNCYPTGYSYGYWGR